MREMRTQGGRGLEAAQLISTRGGLLEYGQQMTRDDRALRSSQRPGSPSIKVERIVL
jgi:hypothetical protein